MQQYHTALCMGKIVTQHQPISSTSTLEKLWPDRFVDEVRLEVFPVHVICGGGETAM
jgi:hypothetical protein